MEASLKQIRARVRGTWRRSGSVLAGTIESRCTGITSHLEVESDDDPALIAALIQSARNGCYAEAALREAVPITSTVTLNGSEFDCESYPKKPPRGRRS